MRYRRLGKSGLKVSVIGLGANQFGGKVGLEETKAIIHAAHDLGVNLIDTADVYQNGRSEEFIGKSVAGWREQVVIATKVRSRTGEGPNNQGASRKHILDGVEDSLRRLGTDYIDLYQIHRWDEDTPIEETMRAFDDLVRSGKIRYLGASNFNAWQLTWANALAEMNGWTHFISIQPHYNMLERDIEGELIPACEYFNLGILPYFPLAGGFLTGKYRQGQKPPVGSRGETSAYVQRHMNPINFARLERLKRFAEQRGHSLTDLAHAWLLAQPQVSSVISGATRVEHIRSNIEADEWQMTPEEMDEVNTILDGDQHMAQP